MTVAKVLELSSQSDQGFDDALRRGIAKASETVDGIRSAWIEDHEVLVSDGKVTGYRVHMKVTFVLKE